MNRFLISIFVSAVVSTGAVASAAAEPTVTQAANLAERAAACTFTGNTGAAQASASQRLCSTIVLSDVAVPSGQALDLDDLQDDTTVRHYRDYTLIIYSNIWPTCFQANFYATGQVRG